MNDYNLTIDTDCRHSKDILMRNLAFENMSVERSDVLTFQTENADETLGVLDPQLGIHWSSSADDARRTRSNSASISASSDGTTAPCYGPSRSNDVSRAKTSGTDSELPLQCHRSIQSGLSTCSGPGPGPGPVAC